MGTRVRHKVMTIFDYTSASASSNSRPISAEDTMALLGIENLKLGGTGAMRVITGYQLFMQEKRGTIYKGKDFGVALGHIKKDWKDLDAKRKVQYEAEAKAQTSAKAKA